MVNSVNQTLNNFAGTFLHVTASELNEHYEKKGKMSKV